MFLEDKSKFPQVDQVAAHFTLDSLISWLETKQSEREYNFMDCTGGCLIGQYFTAVGVRFSTVAGTCYSVGLVYHDIPETFRAVARCIPFTFAGALTRARSIKAGT